MTIKKILISFFISCSAMATEQVFSPEEEALKRVPERILIEETGPSPVLLVPNEVLLQILQFDRRNSHSFIFVCKSWRDVVLENQKMERTIIEAWQNGIHPFNLEETKKGFYRFMNYFPPLVHQKDGTLFSNALRAEMSHFLGCNQRQIVQWKVGLKGIGLPVKDEPFIFQNRSTFSSLKHIFSAHQKLNRFLFLSSQQNVCNLVFEVAFLANEPIQVDKDNQALSDQMLSLFKIIPEPEEISLFKLAGSIYRGWRFLQPNCQSLLEADLKTSFGRLLLSKEMGLSYNRERYQKEGNTYLSSQLGQLGQDLLDYTTRAEKALNDMLISLIE